MPVLGEGRSPDVEHLRALANKHGLNKGNALIDRVRAAIAQWPEFADQAGLTEKSAKLIASRIAPP
jgi:serine/threonine-protein kinase HipA